MKSIFLFLFLLLSLLYSCLLPFSFFMKVQIYIAQNVAVLQGLNLQELRVRSQFINCE